MAVELHLMPHRRVGPLRAVHALTDRAPDADRVMRTPPRHLEFIGIDKVPRMVDLAPKRDSEFRR